MLPTQRSFAATIGTTAAGASSGACWKRQRHLWSPFRLGSLVAACALVAFGLGRHCGSRQSFRIMLQLRPFNGDWKDQGASSTLQSSPTTGTTYRYCTDDLNDHLVLLNIQPLDSLMSVSANTTSSERVSSWMDEKTTNGNNDANHRVNKSCALLLHLNDEAYCGEKFQSNVTWSIHSAITWIVPFRLPAAETLSPVWPSPTIATATGRTGTPTTPSTIPVPTASESLHSHHDTLSLEALVHPALLTHVNPRRILSISNTPSPNAAMLCEIWKHASVQEVVYLTFNHSWFESATTTGTVPSCASHDGTVRSTNIDDVEMASFDVVLMEELPRDRAMAESLLNVGFDALDETGGILALVQQPSRASDSVGNAGKGSTSYQDLFHTVRCLERVGHESIVDYTAASHSAFANHFVLAMKNKGSRARWFRNEAEINLDIGKRIGRTKSAGQFPFLSFDGATMMQYQFTSRLVEEQWCQGPFLDGSTNAKWCSDGHGYSPEIASIPTTMLSVQPSRVANGGRGVFTTIDIAKGAAMGLEEYGHMIFLPDPTMNWIDQSLVYFGDASSEFWSVLYTGYVEGYGFSCLDYGPMAAAVEPGIMSFLNHGCNGTYNTGMLLTETELTVELGRGPAGIVSYDIPAYHPRMTRHFPSTPDDVNVALRDIPAGSELLDNYLVFGGVDNVEYWDENLVDLKNMCSGRSGSITQYEKAAVVNHSTAPLR